LSYNTHSTAVHTQPAFILKSRRYRETSLIVDLLTRDFGRVSVLAKGVRQVKSKTAGLLQPFVPLLVSFTGKSDLKTLTQVELNDPNLMLKGLSIYSGFYINELIMHFLFYSDPHPQVFEDYRQCLNSLKQPEIEQALRLFELNLLENVGYGLQLLHDVVNNKPVEEGKTYQFRADQGPVESANAAFSGLTLRAIQARKFNDKKILKESKKLMRTVIDYHLQGRKLQSRAMIAEVCKHINVPADMTTASQSESETEGTGKADAIIANAFPVSRIM